MATIRTVRGDIAADQLGVCYGHEHVLTAPPPGEVEPDLLLADEAAAVRELTAFRRSGGRAVVEMTTRDYGRRAAGLLHVSTLTGVHIVAASGLHKEKWSARVVADRSIADLAAEFVREVTQGLDGGTACAGLIKAGSSLNSITATEEKVFRAAARAHLACGAPISTHTEAGTMALEQVALLQSEGVDPSHVVIGHLDRRPDPDYHARVAATGCYLGYDQFGKSKYLPDEERIALVQTMVTAGRGRQLLLAGDMARRSSWRSYGQHGPGFTHILDQVVPRLRALLGDSAVDDLLIHNPARAFALLG